MHLKSCKTIYCIVIIFSLVWLTIPSACFSDTQFKTAVIVSKKIKPYIHVVDGITDALGGNAAQMDVFFLSFPNNTDTQINNEITRQLQEGQYDLVTAVGPEAAVLVWGVQLPFKRLYTAVLDPGSLPWLPSDACGISLRIPVDVQLGKIVHTFRFIKKIGLIFDPRHNQWFFEKASSIAGGQGLEIIALPVGSKTQISGVLKKNMEGIDAIWMIPDQTVISEKIIHYVIKQGIYNQMGVIGYNSFFIRSGAFFSFEFDYEALGKQTGQAITASLETDVCPQDPPVFNAIINQKIVEKLGIRVTR
jgi:ABC-type uncharacterized transport system substrate-binding protein